MTDQEQREHALGIANQVRIERAKIRRDIAGRHREASRERAAEVLLGDLPDCLNSLAAQDFVRYATYIGRTTAVRYCHAARVAPAARLERTTPRQREALAACLRGNVDEVEFQATRRERAVLLQSKVAA